MAKRKRATKNYKEEEDEDYCDPKTTQDAMEYGFELHKAKIYNVNTKKVVKRDALIQCIPTMGKQESRIKVTILDTLQAKKQIENSIDLLLPELGCGLDTLKERISETVTLEAKLAALQEEIASARYIIKTVMKQMNSRLVFANLGHDIICKIYEYCCSLPLDVLKTRGMDTYSFEFRQNFIKKNSPIDSQGNMNPMYFSLVCKVFAEALNRKPCALIIRRATLLPSAQYLSKIDTLPLFYAEPNKNLAKKLASMDKKSTNKNGVFHPVHLKLECKRGIDSVQSIISKYKPQVLTLCHLDYVPKLTLPDTIHTLSVAGKYTVFNMKLVVRENLLEILQTTPSIHTVIVEAELATRYFLEGVLKLDHVKHVDCSAALNDLPYAELPELIEKYHSLGKTIKLGIPKVFRGGPFGSNREQTTNHFLCLAPYQKKGIFSYKNVAVSEHSTRYASDKNAEYTDANFEKNLLLNVKKRAPRRKPVTTQKRVKRKKQSEEEAVASEEQDDSTGEEQGSYDEEYSTVGTDDDEDDVPAKKRQRKR